MKNKNLDLVIYMNDFYKKDLEKFSVSQNGLTVYFGMNVNSFDEAKENIKKYFDENSEEFNKKFRDLLNKNRAVHEAAN